MLRVVLLIRGFMYVYGCVRHISAHTENSDLAENVVQLYVFHPEVFSKAI